MQRPSSGAMLIAIGDELLRGETLDSNAAFIAAELTARGVAVRRKLTIPDELDVIVESLRSAMAAYELVISTGGIGPTPDDLTRPAAALACGRQLVLDARAEAEYRRRGVKELTPGQREMCRLPEDCELICAPEGGAPGFRIDNLYVLPGVPSVLKAMWPGIADRFSGAREHTASFEVRIGESRFAGLMREFAQQHPQYKFGSYPHLRADGWVVELRVRGSDMAGVEQAAREFEAAIQGLPG